MAIRRYLNSENIKIFCLLAIIGLLVKTDYNLSNVNKNLKDLIGHNAGLADSLDDSNGTIIMYLDSIESNTDCLYYYTRFQKDPVGRLNPC